MGKKYKLQIETTRKGWVTIETSPGPVGMGAAMDRLVAAGYCVRLIYPDSTHEPTRYGLTDEHLNELRATLGALKSGQTFVL